MLYNVCTKVFSHKILCTLPTLVTRYLVRYISVDLLIYHFAVT